MAESLQKIDAALKAVTRGDRSPAEELLPLVYAQLRNLARARMVHMAPGNTFQPTALVHEAYLRVTGNEDPGWNSRGHFFGAAAEAMRQILVDQARRKASLKRGGDRNRVDMEYVELPIEPPADDLLDLDRALKRLENEDARKAQIVMLRYFAGLNRQETATVLEMAPRTLDRHWEYTRAWLHREMTRAPIGEEARGHDR